MAGYKGFRYPDSYYHAEKLGSGKVLTTAEIRKEYSRLRDVAQKRLHRFESAGATAYQAYKTYKDAFPVLAKLETDDDVIFALSEVSQFLRSKQNSLSGIKEIRNKALATMREQGIDFVDEANFAQFARFMQSWKEGKWGTTIKGSEDVVALFRFAEERRLDVMRLRSSFTEFVQNIEELENMPQMEGATWSDYRRLLKRREKSSESVEDLERMSENISKTVKKYIKNSKKA